MQLLNYSNVSNVVKILQKDELATLFNHVAKQPFLINVETSICKKKKNDVMRSCADMIYIRSLA